MSLSFETLDEQELIVVLRDLSSHESLDVKELFAEYKKDEKERKKKKTSKADKIKEQNTKDLINCVKSLYLKKDYLSDNTYLSCENNINAAAVTELLRRLYLPLYLPVLALIVCFLTLSSKDQFNYKKFKLRVFLISVLVVIISEFSLSYSGSTLVKSLSCVFIPIILFIFLITIYKKKIRYI